MDNAQLVALSRQSALQRQIDVIANNIANVDTVGFKARDIRFHEFQLPKAEVNDGRGLARQVSFVADRGLALQFNDGALMRTGAPLDVALRGNLLLAVSTPAGERYTRSGALSLNDQGQLMTADGFLVMGDGGPITVTGSAGEISITPDGVVSGREGAFGRLKLMAVKSPSDLINEGRNLYASKTPLTVESNPVLVPGALEKSNVEPVLAMSRLIEVNRAYTSLAGLMQKLDDKNGSAIERLANIPN